MKPFFVEQNKKIEDKRNKKIEDKKAQRKLSLPSTSVAENHDGSSNPTDEIVSNKENLDRQLTEV
jgi:hypothetical protein